MSERIRQLEDALENLQSTCSSQSHPLLQADLLNIKSTVGLYGGAQVGTDVSTAVSDNNSEPEGCPPRMDVDPKDQYPNESRVSKANGTQVRFIVCLLNVTETDSVLPQATGTFRVP